MALSVSLVSQSIPNLVNGVSQQPFTLRLASQGEEQENALSTVSKGLKRRPGSKHIAKISNTPTTNAFVHTINRDTSEQYEVILTNGGIKVFDLAGVEKTVNAPYGLSYLAATDPANAFAVTTVADYSFICNKTVTPLARTDTHPATNNFAIITVKAGNYGVAYRVFWNGVLIAQYTTPDGGEPAHAYDIDTTVIAATLGAQIVANGVSAAREGNTIVISTPGDFTISTTDGVNGNAMSWVKGQVQRFEDLPNRAIYTGIPIEIVGSNGSPDDNYWVNSSNGGGTKGTVWKEAAKPLTSYGVQPGTMPYILRRESDGTFTFTQAPWDLRLVGDIISNPNPSFINRKIRDIFFHRNRLGFLAGDSIIMSEAGSFFNFFRTTVTTVLDTDPIDVNASHTEVSDLFHAIPFNKDLLLFSQLTQFVMEGGDLLTPKTASTAVSTAFECNVQAKPVAMGKNVYFAIPRGPYSGIREYFAEQNNTTDDAEEITAHVPEYIPANVSKLVAASNDSTLVALSSNNRQAIWVWRSYWKDGQRLQNAWSRWDFPVGTTVLSASFIKSELVLVVSRADGTYLESMDISSSPETVGEPYAVGLDRRIRVLKANLVFDGTKTYWVPPYIPNDGTYLAVVANGQPKPAGYLYNPVWNGTQLVIGLGNHTASDLIIGRKQQFRYMLSPITVKKATSSGATVSDTQGRLTIGRIKINYADTGFFQVRVTPKGRDPYLYTFTGKLLGEASATLGKISLDTGQFTVPVQAQNTEVDIEIISDSPLPLSILSIDWEGKYVKRSRSV